MKYLLSSILGLCLLTSCNQKDSKENSAYREQRKDSTKFNVNESEFIDPSFGYITSKTMSQFKDEVIFASGVSIKDSMKIKEEILKSITGASLKDPFDSFFGGCCTKSLNYTYFFVPEDSQFAYINFNGKDMKLKLEYGGIPYFADRPLRNELSVFTENVKKPNDKKRNFTEMVVTVDKTFKIQVIDTLGKIKKAEFYVVAGTD